MASYLLHTFLLMAFYFQFIKSHNFFSKNDAFSLIFSKMIFNVLFDFPQSFAEFLLFVKIYAEETTGKSAWRCEATLSGHHTRPIYDCHWYSNCQQYGHPVWVALAIFSWNISNLPNFQLILMLLCNFSSPSDGLITHPRQTLPLRCLIRLSVCC